MPDARVAAVTAAVVRSLSDAGLALEVLAVADVFDNALAAELLERFGATNGDTLPVLAALKALPFVAPVNVREWQLQPAAREALITSLRRRDEGTFSRASEYLAGHFADRATELTGRLARECRWHAAVQLLPVDASRAFDHLETLVSQAVGPNEQVDVDASASLARSNPKVVEEYSAEVAYFVGRRAYLHGDRTTAEREFRLVLQGTNRVSMLSVASHLLANMLLERGGNVAEAERFARRSLQLRRQHFSTQVPPVEVTLARILLRREDLHPSHEVRELLDDAAERFKLAGDVRGTSMALVNRAGYFVRARSLRAAEDDAREAVALSENLRPGREHRNALNTLAVVLVRKGNRADLARAVQVIAESERVGRGLPDEAAHGAVLLNTRSLLEEARGNLEKAISYMEDELLLDQELGRVWQANLARKRLTHLRRDRGANRGKGKRRKQ